MSKKLIGIFLSLFFTVVSAAKPAPNNTFRFDSTSSQDSRREIDQKKIKEIQDKIDAIRLEEDQNFFIKKFNEFRINRLRKSLR